MSSVFEIKEHIVECQHIREYARATANSQEDVLKLAVKQYIPLDNPEPKQGDITIIGAHANGFPKELYEPLWEDIHTRSKAHGFRIRNIWIADVANQGASGVLNEHLLGNDPSWLDHSRDLLHLINVFRSQMPAPIIGMGHSFGGTILANLSLIHPRLLQTLILLDPVLQSLASAFTFGAPPALMSTHRRDIWPTRTAALDAFQKSKFYATWDPRVLSLWCTYGIRPTPTPLYPSKTESATLTTTKHQECFTFLRPRWEALDPEGRIVKRDQIPDMQQDLISQFPFYRGEPPMISARLEELRPSVMYIFGGESDVSSPAAVGEKLRITGSGRGGSGGRESGRVDGVVLEGVGHLVAMEAVGRCADISAGWIGKEMRRWEGERREFEVWSEKSFEEKTTLGGEWKRRIGPLPKNTNTEKTKL